MEATRICKTVQAGKQEAGQTPCTDSASAIEGKVRRSLLNPPVINPDRLKTAKALVEKAVKSRKVFSIQGPYPVIRAGLRTRGWVERRLPHQPQPWSRPRAEGDDDGNDADDSEDDDDSPEEGENEEDPDGIYDLMSRMVRNEITYFYWTTLRETSDGRILRKEQMINHYAKSCTFTTKVGLCVNLRNLRWFDSADPDTFFPRCYRLGAEDEKHAFIEDYRRTACTNLLQWVVERSKNNVEEGEGVNVDISIEGQKKPCKRRVKPFVSSEIIDSALIVCQEFLGSVEHSDIDISLEIPKTLTEDQWSEFINNYYLVVHEGAVIKDISQYVESCQIMLQRLQEVCPQLDTDGIQNIWIVKPGAKSRGRGIMCVKRLDEILKQVDSNPSLIKDSKWVVQKYLERPLLVYGTKFDLRQWFLVTNWNPLTVWFYNKCYLRFSTQPYTLETLDNSVHLCNNSIQKHLQPSQQRHPGVPEDNMWSCDQFRSFLSGQGLGAQWGTLVVPGMKKAVIHALLTAQDLVESRRSSFELYGADFMLGRDLQPWLIEINASPTMAPSTAVTTRLCATVQEDTLKVVLDRRLDRTAPTGGFQLIYKQAAVEVPHYVGVNLLVEGSRIKRRLCTAPLKEFIKSELHPMPPAPRRCAPSKENVPVAEKTVPQPGRPVKNIMRKIPCVRVIPPQKPHPTQSKIEFSLVGDVGKLHQFGFPLDPRHLFDHTPQSRSLDCWRKPQALKAQSGKMRTFAPNKRVVSTLPLGVIGLQEPSKEPYDVLVPPKATLIQFSRIRLHNSFQHQRTAKNVCAGKDNH